MLAQGITQSARIRVGVNAAIIRSGEILVVEFEDETGYHLNLPGGGVDAGESLLAALVREVREETCLEVEVGRLLLVWEYEPTRYAGRYGPTHKLGLVFLASRVPAASRGRPTPLTSTRWGCAGCRWRHSPRLGCSPISASAWLTSYRTQVVTTRSYRRASHASELNHR